MKPIISIGCHDPRVSLLLGLKMEMLNQHLSDLLGFVVRGLYRCKKPEESSAKLQPQI